jgi:hypothetical protein
MPFAYEEVALRVQFFRNIVLAVKIILVKDL